MKTIALRFANNFAPIDGTIAEHQKVIDKLGFVWYGKLGTSISTTISDQILKNEEKKILLIHSGSAKRYWAHVDLIQREVPKLETIPEYYRNMAGQFKTWFRVIRFEEAPKDIMSKCTVASSGSTLSQASKHSMSPYFIIEVNE